MDNVYELIEAHDEILKTAMPDFDFANPDFDPIEIAHILAQTMIHNNGLGIAANQLGFPVRAFAITGNPITVCFNPKVIDYSPETVYLEEGCLSFPDLYVKIKRPRTIKVRYTEPNGNIVTKVFDGMTARVFQHELDHLDGIVHTQRANRFHLEQARKKAKKMPKLTSDLSEKANETWVNLLKD